MGALLLAVQRVVRCVEVEHDAHRRLAISLHEQVDEQALDGLSVVIELVMAIEADLATMLFWRGLF